MLSLATLAAAALLLLVVALIAVRVARRPRGPNPFARDARRKREPLVHDLAQRHVVLKPFFKPELVADAKYDAVVVGSGLGGLSVAVLLSRVGKRVLVLEQHGRIGGCCHTFEEGGFEFDTGVHYIGEMHPKTLLRRYFDQLTDGQVDWAELEKEFDIIGIGEERETFRMIAGLEELKASLKVKFPEEAANIDTFFVELAKARKAFLGFAMLKMMPPWMGRMMSRFGVLKRRYGYEKYALQTAKKFLDKITKNEELKAVLTYNWGDYGTLPDEASFLMHASLVNHFMRGGYYPVGGPSELPYHMAQIIERAGGKVLSRAPVSRILLDSTGTAVGVHVKTRTHEVDIMAPIVISDAGVVNTYEHLLDIPVPAPMAEIITVEKAEPPISCFSLFLGLRGSAEELGLKRQNYWWLNSTDLSGDARKYMMLSAEEASMSRPPGLFISFPSTKDPKYAERYPNKSVCEVIAFGKHEWFKKWDGQEVKQRGRTYEELKKQFEISIKDEVVRIFPQLRGQVEFSELGTPVTNAHYYSSFAGVIYGLDHKCRRFTPEAGIQLRPQTAIPNLYLTGQDAMTCGVVGAAMGGLLCASQILNRNLLADLARIKPNLDDLGPTGTAVGVARRQ